MIEHNITAGLKYALTKEVGVYDTGAKVGSGTLDYMLSTPALAAMVIEASTKLLNPLVPENCTTVGKQFEVVHEFPTLLGETVTVEVLVTKVVGTHIHLAVTTRDKKGEIAEGSHERIVVESEALMSEAYRRAGTPKP